VPKPDVTIPDGPPPAELVVEDLVEGDGEVAEPGQRVSVHYVGVAWSTGSQFDASWDRGEPFEFGLGAGQVIAGWDQGVAGMRAGGRRRLSIPPHLGYGSQGAAGVIKGGETLVFVVDLLAARGVSGVGRRRGPNKSMHLMDRWRKRAAETGALV
jgi:peptidylprolyl isomerase